MNRFIIFIGLLFIRISTNKNNNIIYYIDSKDSAVITLLRIFNKYYIMTLAPQFASLPPRSGSVIDKRYPITDASVLDLIGMVQGLIWFQF